VAKHIKTTGEVVEVSPKNGRTFEFDEMQALIGGGYVGHGFLRDGTVLIADEDGYYMSHNLAYNKVASKMFGVPYSGDVAVLSREEFGLPARKSA